MSAQQELISNLHAISSHTWDQIFRLHRTAWSVTCDRLNIPVIDSETEIPETRSIVVGTATMPQPILIPDPEAMESPDAGAIAVMPPSAIVPIDEHHRLAIEGCLETLILASTTLDELHCENYRTVFPNVGTLISLFDGFEVETAHYGAIQAAKCIINLYSKIARGGRFVRASFGATGRGLLEPESSIVAGGVHHSMCETQLQVFVIAMRSLFAAYRINGDPVMASPSGPIARERETDARRRITNYLSLEMRRATDAIDHEKPQRERSKPTFGAKVDTFEGITFLSPKRIAYKSKRTEGQPMAIKILKSLLKLRNNQPVAICESAVKAECGSNADSLANQVTNIKLMLKTIDYPLAISRTGSDGAYMLDLVSM